LALDLTTAPYDDGTSSSFGSANVFSGGTETQDLSALRGQAIPEPSGLMVIGTVALAGVLRRRRSNISITKI